VNLRLNDTFELVVFLESAADAWSAASPVRAMTTLLFEVELPERWLVGANAACLHQTRRDDLKSLRRIGARDFLLQHLAVRPVVRLGEPTWEYEERLLPGRILRQLGTETLAAVRAQLEASSGTCPACTPGQHERFLELLGGGVSGRQKRCVLCHRER
jgi:hypothetical protein